MFRGVIAFVAGVVALQFQTALPALSWFLLFPFLLFFALRCKPLRLPLFGCLGFLWALLYAHLLSAGALDPSMEGRDVEIEGVVASLPERAGPRLRFQFEIKRLRRQGNLRPAPGRVRLSWYRNAPLLKVGERWRLRVRLRRPHGFRNPGGFDYEGWLFRKGIRATGYVRDVPENRRLNGAGPGYALASLRQSLRDRIHRAVPDPASAGLITALVIGDRSGLDRVQWDRFARTGTNHLMAISGLHLGMLSGGVFFLFQWLWRRSSRACLWLPAPRAAVLAALLAALLYAALAGFAVPVQRALVMLTVVMGSLFLRRQPMSGGLMLALLLVVVLDPQAVMSAGFWLSFAAVALIFYRVVGACSRTGLWRRWGEVQWLVAVGLAPLLLAWGMPVSLFAPLVNLFVVPLFGLLVVPLALSGSLVLLLSEKTGALLLQLPARVLETIISGLDWIAAQPHAVWEPGGVAGWVWLPVGAGVLLLLAPPGLPGRWLGALFLAPLFLVRPTVPDAGAFWFTLLDVGQGLSAVVQTRRHTLVFDAGARFSDDFDAGSAVVAPFLRQAGVAQIDRLVLSNADNDHAGGAARLVEQITVREILSGEPEALALADVRQCAEGESWRWDGVVFRFLYPARQGRAGGNNASCVLLVENAAGRVLLTADIEREAESWLLRNHPGRLAADIVQVPHHGSNSSSTTAFVAAVSASHALIPVGYKNRYRFPRPEVVRRWRAAGAVLFDTASQGAIRYRLHPAGGIEGPDVYRTRARRYWHAGGGPG